MTATVGPQLLSIKSIGPDTASTLLVTSAATPSGCITSAASPASAAPRRCKRAAANGNAIALTAAAIAKPTPHLWRIVIVRMGTDQRTRDYVERRVAEGKQP